MRDSQTSNSLASLAAADDETPFMNAMYGSKDTLNNHSIDRKKGRKKRNGEPSINLCLYSSTLNRRNVRRNISFLLRRSLVLARVLRGRLLDVRESSVGALTSVGLVGELLPSPARVARFGLWEEFVESPVHQYAEGVGEDEAAGREAVSSASSGGETSGG
jgi:hypothetical protein